MTPPRRPSSAGGRREAPSYGGGPGGRAGRSRLALQRRTAGNRAHRQRAGGPTRPDPGPLVARRGAGGGEVQGACWQRSPCSVSSRRSRWSRSRAARAAKPTRPPSSSAQATGRLRSGALRASGHGRPRSRGRVRRELIGARDDGGHGRARRLRRPPRSQLPQHRASLPAPNGRGGRERASVSSTALPEDGRSRRPGGLLMVAAARPSRPRTPRSRIGSRTGRGAGKDG